MKESIYQWNEYKFRFTEKAKSLDLSSDRALVLLDYAENLFKKKLPVVYDIQHLSFLTGYRESYLQRAIKGGESFYRSFKIAKKNGNSRHITEPLPGLKEIQYWILENIIKKVSPNPINNAYVENKSIITNAKFHTKQHKVLNLDIEKYFDNIKREYVAAFFLGLGYNPEVSDILSKLITLNNCLPQGSPTSPYLSSILTKELDERLLKYAQINALRYSRYADDITVSGNFNTEKIIFEIKKTLKEHGFSANDKKTTLKKPHQRQMVTGIVVNKKMSIKKEDIRLIRQEIYYIKKFGLESHLRKKNIVKTNYINHLFGKLNFFLSVKKRNPELLKLKYDLTLALNT